MNKNVRTAVVIPVHLIERRFATDVCSVYLLEADRASLVLAATVGLRPEVPAA